MSSERDSCKCFFGFWLVHLVLGHVLTVAIIVVFCRFLLYTGKYSGCSLDFSVNVLPKWLLRGGASGNLLGNNGICFVAVVLVILSFILAFFDTVIAYISISHYLRERTSCRKCKSSVEAQQVLLRLFSEIQPLFAQIDSSDTHNLQMLMNNLPKGTDGSVGAAAVQSLHLRPHTSAKLAEAVISALPELTKSLAE